MNDSADVLGSPVQADAESSENAEEQASEVVTQNNSNRRRVGFSMTQSSKYNRRSFNEHQISYGPYSNLQTANYFHTPIFVHPNGNSSNGFDNQYFTFPSNQMEHPILLIDKSVSILHANMLPNNGTFGNVAGYFVNPAAIIPQITQHPMNRVCIQPMYPVNIPYDQTRDKSTQVNFTEDHFDNDICDEISELNLESAAFEPTLSINDTVSLDSTNFPSPLEAGLVSGGNSMTNLTFENVKEIEQPQSIKIDNVKQTKSWASLFSNKQVVNNSNVVNNAKPLVQSKPVVENVKESIKPEENIVNGIIEPQAKDDKEKSITPVFSRMNKEDLIKISRIVQNFSGRQSAPALNLRGLQNDSNYCYANAVLQALLACPMFFNFIDSLPSLIPEQSTTIQFEDTTIQYPIYLLHIRHIFGQFCYMYRNGFSMNRQQNSAQLKAEQQKMSSPLRIGSFHALCDKLMRKRNPSQQEDAHEFLCRFLYELHNECLVFTKPPFTKSTEEIENDSVVNPSDQINGAATESEQNDDNDEEWQEYYGKRIHIHREIHTDNSPISDIFGGCLRTSLERGGGINSSNLEPFYSLSIDIDSQNVILALKALGSKVSVSGLSNPSTKRPTKGYQTIALEKLPPCLILHLKCFSWNNSQKKIFSKISIPIDLNIPQEILSKTANVSLNARQYKLFAVIHHCGKSVLSGHYICDVFHPGLKNWLRCDDQRVRPVSSRDVINPMPRNDSDPCPFMLFYRQK